MKIQLTKKSERTVIGGQVGYTNIHQCHAHTPLFSKIEVSSLVMIQPKSFFLDPMTAWAYYLSRIAYEETNRSAV